MSRLQSVQNAAARLLTRTLTRDHVRPRTCSCLPLLYILKIILYVFKALNRLAPSYFADLLITYAPPRSLRGADQQFLMFPKTRLKKRKDFALIVAPKLWNKLSLHVRLAPSLPVFKSLKTHFYSLDFNPV